MFWQQLLDFSVYVFTLIKEIAEIQETSQNAVKQHLSRGRTHLRGLLSIN